MERDITELTTKLTAARQFLERVTDERSVEFWQRCIVRLERQIDRKESTMRRTDVLEKCQMAADAIKGLPIAEWPGWVCYLMESLDEGGFDDQTMLEAIRDDLNTRLAQGRW